MTELYPDDATLLAMTVEEHTGVEMIETGQSPYYLQFRKLVHRLLLATARANDLRVYRDGPLAIGVKAGRSSIAGNAIAFEGAADIAVSDEATTFVWLDAAGAVQTATDAMPGDRATFFPLAEITAAAGAITAVLDRRGEGMHVVPAVDSLHVAYGHDGQLTASQADKLLGVVPVNGVVADVIFSVAGNIESDTSTDGVTVTAKVNGATVCETDPALSDAAGAGFRSTARGDGAPAAIKSDGTQRVSRGDVLTVDLTRSVSGVVSSEMRHIVVLVLIRAEQSE